jgi:alkanesulfonate monooxygenase SsuD/methylene tetrahydromethanopterin reductase-like flavin-dependent oxidoreductase (luciferase family)
MRFGIVLPYADAGPVAEIAHDAEEAGWDGVFVADALWGIDPWVVLTAVAMETETIKFGTMLTPLSRRRPWKLASETATLDRLSNGRLILSVGLGALDTGFAEFGEVTDRHMRAELLDEGLEILTGLWKGEPIEFTGEHFRIRRHRSFPPPPPPVQTPRIPIWVAAGWPRARSMARAIRYDGLIPHVMGKSGRFRKTTPADVAEMRAYVTERGAGSDFDIIAGGGDSPGDDPARAAEMVAPWADAGATWWIEEHWSISGEELRTRIRQGPPLI